MSVVAGSLKKKEGIGDGTVTGVQTCALPIYSARPGRHSRRPAHPVRGGRRGGSRRLIDRKSGVEGKRVDVGGRRVIKKKRRNRRWNCDWSSDVCSSDL